MGRLSLVLILVCSVTLAGFASPAADRSSWISLNSLSFDTREGEPALPAELRATEEAGEASPYRIVKFEGPIRAGQRTALESCVERIYAYLPHYAYLVKADPAKSPALRAAPGVSWTGSYHPAYKISGNVADITEQDEKGLYIVMVQVYPDADLAGVEAEMRGLGMPTEEGSAANPFFSRIRYLLDPGEVVRFREAMARIPEVFWIDIEPRKAFLNDTSIWVGQSGVDGGQATPVFDHGITGEGQIICALDTGIDPDMCYFYDTALGTLPPTNECDGGTVVDLNQRKVIAVDFLWNSECSGGISGTEWDTQDHGTHVLGTMAGDDYVNPITHDPGDGMAPGAKLVAQDCGYQYNDCADCPGIGCPVTDLNPVFQQTYDQGVRIHSNSWGDNENASPQYYYTTASEDVDQFMWNNPDFLLFFAAGNSGPGSGTVGSPSTAKSCVSVGATLRGSSAESLASFSSWGPTEDGRIKPDVTAPGSSIVSADNDQNVTSYNCNTQGMSGTSMACPTAAGLATLIRQYYMDGWYPTGQENAPDAFTPSAALVKASLVNSAQNMTGETAIPSDEQGWGRVLLDNALYWEGETRKLWVTDDAGFPTGSTSSKFFAFHVVSGSVPLKVTLAWTDYPSTPAASPNINNDLDLTVEAPGGSTYLGNVFSGGISSTGGSADRLNTLEQVLIPSPSAGVVTITVGAHNIPDGTQPFALVVTGDIASACEGSLYLDRGSYGCSDTIAITLLDGDLIGTGSQAVTAWSDSEGSSGSPAETVTLTETPADSGQFSGTVNTSSSTAGGDGAVGVTHGDTITVRYVDADACGTPNIDVDGTALAECVPSAEFSASGAVSDDCAAGGAGDADGLWDAGEVVTFSVTLHNDGTEPLTGVTAAVTSSTPGVTVVDGSADFPDIPVDQTAVSDAPHFAARLPASLNCGDTVLFEIQVSADQGGPWADAFERGIGLPTGGTVTVWSDDFETDRGWILGAAGEWECTAPTGNGGENHGNGDPSGAVSGSNVLGNDLTGTGSNEYDYEAGVSASSATSPAIDCTGYTNVQLTFRRWLNVEQPIYDTATVLVSHDGSAWTQVWQNGAEITDGAWSLQTYDISATADGESTVYVRFEIDTDGGWQYSGWNIDDVTILGDTPPGCDTNPCPAAAPPPPVADGNDGSAMTISPASGDTLHVSFDASTCSGDHAVILYGGLDDFSAYMGAVEAGCNAGGTGEADFDISAEDIWFNLVWVDGSGTAGHPGQASTGARTLTAAGLCGVAGDDHGDDTCD